LATHSNQKVIKGYGRPNIAEFADIAEKNIRDFKILSLNLSSAPIAETTDIAEIAWAFKVFIANKFEGVMNDILFQN
jgi:hypothetical protein